MKLFTSLSPKHRQLILFWGVLVLALVCISFVLSALLKEAPLRVVEDKVETTNIATVGQRINPQEVWVERLESENKLTLGKIKALESALKAHIKSQAEKDLKTQDAIEATSLQNQSTEALSGQGVPSSNLLPQPHVEDSPVEALDAPKGVRKIVLKLTKRALPAVSQKKTIETTIPAGTFVKAVLLGGVDASTSITAQSDPRPVLLRLTDPGTLPRKFKSDLKACHVLASSYGDWSSERVYMRLEKLTCTERLTGEISETEVSGYIVGEDGRAGVRGIVADRAGPMIRNSLMGGFLSGMSNFFGAQQQSSVFPVSPLGARNALGPTQMLGAGAANGLSTAMDKYAEFFIKRAEQLQPVLQVAAGRSVDIVFTQGTSIGDTHVKKTLSKIRNRSRKQAVQKLESTPDTHDWLPNSN